jgi:hypothetical protein
MVSDTRSWTKTPPRLLNFNDCFFPENRVSESPLISFFGQALTHKPAPPYETRLENEHGATNEAEDARRPLRTEQLETSAHRADREPSSLRLGARRATQRSVKSLRWLRQALRGHLSEALAVPRLASLYSSS